MSKDEQNLANEINKLTMIERAVRDLCVLADKMSAAGDHANAIKLVQVARDLATVSWGASKSRLEVYAMTAAICAMNRAGNVGGCRAVLNELHRFTAGVNDPEIHRIIKPALQVECQLPPI